MWALGGLCKGPASSVAVSPPACRPGPLASWQGTSLQLGSALRLPQLCTPIPLPLALPLAPNPFQVDITVRVVILNLWSQLLVSAGTAVRPLLLQQDVQRALAATINPSAALPATLKPLQRWARGPSTAAMCMPCKRTYGEDGSLHGMCIVVPWQVPTSF